MNAARPALVGVTATPFVAVLALMAVGSAGAALETTGTTTVPTPEMTFSAAQLWNDLPYELSLDQVTGTTAPPACTGPLSTVFPVLVRTQKGDDETWYSILPLLPHYLDVEQAQPAYQDQLEVTISTYPSMDVQPGVTVPAPGKPTGLDIRLTDLTQGALRGATVTFYVALDGNVEHPEGNLAPSRVPSAADVLDSVQEPLDPVTERLQDFPAARRFTAAIPLHEADAGTVVRDARQPHCWASIGLRMAPDDPLPASTRIVLDRPDNTADPAVPRTDVIVTPRGSPSSLTIEAGMYNGTVAVDRVATPSAYAAHPRGLPVTPKPLLQEHVYTLTWDDLAAQGMMARASMGGVPAHPLPARPDGFVIHMYTPKAAGGLNDGLRMHWVAPQVAMDLRIDARRHDMRPSSLRAATPALPTDFGLCIDTAATAGWFGLKYDANAGMPWLRIHQQSRDVKSPAFDQLWANVSDVAAHVQVAVRTDTDAGPAPLQWRNATAIYLDTARQGQFRSQHPDTPAAECLPGVGVGAASKRMGMRLWQNVTDASGTVDSVFAETPMDTPAGGLPTALVLVTNATVMRSPSDDGSGGTFVRLEEKDIRYNATDRIGLLHVNVTRERGGAPVRIQDIVAQDVPTSANVTVVERRADASAEAVRDMGVRYRANAAIRFAYRDWQYQDGVVHNATFLSGTGFPLQLDANLTRQPHREVLLSGPETVLRFASDRSASQVGYERIDHDARGQPVDRLRVAVDGLPVAFNVTANDRLVEFEQPAGAPQEIPLVRFSSWKAGPFEMRDERLMELGHVNITDNARAGAVPHLKTFRWHNTDSPRAIDPQLNQRIDATFGQPIHLMVEIVDVKPGARTITTVTSPAMVLEAHLASDFASYLDWDACPPGQEADCRASLGKLTVLVDTRKPLPDLAGELGSCMQRWEQSDVVMTILGLPGHLSLDTDFADYVHGLEASAATQFVELQFTQDAGGHRVDGAACHVQTLDVLFQLGVPDDPASIGVPTQFTVDKFDDADGEFQSARYTGKEEITRLRLVMAKTSWGTTYVEATATGIPSRAWFHYAKAPLRVELTSDGIDDVDFYYSDKSPKTAIPGAQPSRTSYAWMIKDGTGSQVWAHVKGLADLQLALDARGHYSQAVASGGLILQAALLAEQALEVNARVQYEPGVGKDSVDFHLDLATVRTTPRPETCIDTPFVAGCRDLFLDTDFLRYAFEGDLGVAVATACIDPSKDLTCLTADAIDLTFRATLPKALRLEADFGPPGLDPTRSYAAFTLRPSSELTVDELTVLKRALTGPDTFLQATRIAVPASTGDTPSTTFKFGRIEGVAGQAAGLAIDLFAPGDGVSGRLLKGSAPGDRQEPAEATQSVVMRLDAAGSPKTISIDVQRVQRFQFCNGDFDKGWALLHDACGQAPGAASGTHMQQAAGPVSFVLHAFIDTAGHGVQDDMIIRLDEGLPPSLDASWETGKDDPFKAFDPFDAALATKVYRKLWLVVDPSQAINADGAAGNVLRFYMAPYWRDGDDRSRTQVDAIVRAIPDRLELSMSKSLVGSCIAWGRPTSQVRIDTAGTLDLAMLDLVDHAYRHADRSGGYFVGDYTQDELVAAVEPKEADTTVTRNSQGWRDDVKALVTYYDRVHFEEVYTRTTAKLTARDAHADMNICGSFEADPSALPDDQDSKAMRASWTGSLSGSILTTWNIYRNQVGYREATATERAENTWHVMTEAYRTGGAPGRGRWIGDLLIGFADARPWTDETDWTQGNRDCTLGQAAWLKLPAGGWSLANEQASNQVCADGGITVFNYRGGMIAEHGGWDMDDPPDDARLVAGIPEGNVCDGNYQSQGFRGDPTLFGYRYYDDEDPEENLRGDFTSYQTGSGCGAFYRARSTMEQFPTLAD